MNPRRHVSILWSSAVLIVIIVILAIAAGFGATFLLPRAYEARATLYVGQSLTDPNLGYNGILASQFLAQTYGRLATTRPLMSGVISDLGLDTTPQNPAGRGRRRRGGAA